jgi:integrase
MNPTDVKTAIAYSKLSNSSKAGFVLAYDWYVKTNGLTWERPKYKYSLPTPIIPTTRNVDIIIAASTKRYTTIFTLLKETGAEPEELHQTHKNQIDTEQGIISIKGTKLHASGSYKLKPQTAEMLREYIAKNPQDYPFPQPDSMSKMWRRARDKVAENTNQPELKKIPLKSLRNYSGAQFYLNYDKDAIGTMRHLRHKKLETTMHYLRAIVLDQEPEYVCRTAKTIEEDQQLINAGFQYITERDGIKLYRKRK